MFLINTTEEVRFCVSFLDAEEQVDEFYDDSFDEDFYRMYSDPKYWIYASTFYLSDEEEVWLEEEKLRVSLNFIPTLGSALHHAKQPLFFKDLALIQEYIIKFILRYSSSIKGFRLYSTNFKNQTLDLLYESRLINQFTQYLEENSESFLYNSK